MPSKSTDINPKNKSGKNEPAHPAAPELPAAEAETDVQTAIRRAQLDPNRLTRGDLARLQPVVGNRSLQRLLDHTPAPARPGVIPVNEKAPSGTILRNPDFTPEEIRTWCQEWFRASLPASFFQVMVDTNWQMAQGASSGRGAFYVRVAFEPRRATINAFISAYNARFPAGDRPRENQYLVPRSRFLASLEEISLALTLTAGSEFATLPAASATWGRASLDSDPVQVELHRLGGPVTLSAALTLGGQVLATVSHTTHVVTSGVEPERAGRVLSLRQRIESVCAETGMRPDVVMAIISLETGGDPAAGALRQTRQGTTGRSTHIGLMAAGSPTPGPGQTQQQAVDAYVADIERQIRDGIAVFQGKMEMLQRSPYNFSFNTPLTEDDLAIIEMAYAAGEGTMITALRRASSLGRDDWWAADIWIPAILHSGAHDPANGISNFTRGWTRLQFAAELVSYCGMSQEQIDSEFPEPGAQATAAVHNQSLASMRRRLVERVNTRKALFTRAFDVNSASMGELESRDTWVFRSAQYKYRNIDPSGLYITQFMTYRRYYESVLAGRWVPPLLANVIFTEEEATAEEAVEGEAGAGTGAEGTLALEGTGEEERTGAGEGEEATAGEGDSAAPAVETREEAPATE